MYPAAAVGLSNALTSLTVLVSIHIDSSSACPYSSVWTVTLGESLGSMHCLRELVIRGWVLSEAKRHLEAAISSRFGLDWETQAGLKIEFETCILPLERFGVVL